MALFKNIDEVKVHWPVVSSMEFDNILPFIKQAERDYLIPAIGKEQYTELNEWYSAAEPSENDILEALLEKVQPAVALYAYYLWIPSGQLQIGDSGIRIATTETMKTAFQWQIDELRKSIIAQAGSALEAMLEFMEENKDDYDAWIASNAFTVFADSFIRTSKDFTAIYNALGNSRLLFNAIRGQMKKVEDFFIQSELSPSFYDIIKEQLIDDDLTEPNAKLIPMIQKAVAHLTMAHAFAQLNFKMSDDGMLVLNNSGSSIVLNQRQPATPNMLSKAEQQAMVDGKAYLQILRDYLNENIADYPVYAQSDVYNSETTRTEFKNDSTDNYAAMI